MGSRWFEWGGGWRVPGGRVCLRDRAVLGTRVGSCDRGIRLRQSWGTVSCVGGRVCVWMVVGGGGGWVAGPAALRMSVGPMCPLASPGRRFRSQAVHDIFMEQFGRHFTIRRVRLPRKLSLLAPGRLPYPALPSRCSAPCAQPERECHLIDLLVPITVPPKLQVQAGKMDPNYQHPLIHIYLLKRRKQVAGEAGSEAGDPLAAAEATDCAEAEGDPAPADSSAAVGGGDVQGETAAVPHAEGGATGGKGESRAAEAGEERTEGGEPSTGGEAAARSQQQFKTRREGSMLARMLAEVKI